MAISKKTRKLVVERAKGCCEYCQCIVEFVPVPFTMEHIIPKSKGGLDNLINLALACHHCNGTKYTKTTGSDPLTQKQVALYHPRQDNWKTHFKWNEDFSKIIGISPTGRATVNTLRLNHKHIMNLRMVLFLFGEHPPKHTL